MWPSIRLTFKLKNGGWCLPFACIVDVVLHDVWVLYRIDKEKDNGSLPLLAFPRDAVNAIFLKNSKEEFLQPYRNPRSPIICPL